MTSPIYHNTPLPPQFIGRIEHEELLQISMDYKEIFLKERQICIEKHKRNFGSILSFIPPICFFKEAKAKEIQKEFESNIKEQTNTLNQKYNLADRNIRVLVEWETKYKGRTGRKGRNRFTRIATLQFEVDDELVI